MTTDTHLEVLGTVVDSTRDVFTVRCTLGNKTHFAICKLAGKLRYNHIRW